MSDVSALPIGVVNTNRAVKCILMILSSYVSSLINGFGRKLNHLLPKVILLAYEEEGDAFAGDRNSGTNGNQGVFVIAGDMSGPVMRTMLLKQSLLC